jgi:glycerol-3-phosphate dehydrogenase (NAD(P)+)
MKTVCVIGEGAWGTAVATVLAHNGYTVNLWCHFTAVKQTIQELRINQRYLSGIELSQRIIPLTDLKQALDGVSYVFEAIPVQYLRSVLTRCKPYMHKDQTWIVLSKGVEQTTCMFPTQIIEDNAPCSLDLAVVAGPSFAYQVAQEKLTQVVLACAQSSAQQLQSMMNNSYFTTYISNDGIGVQAASAFKNVVALGAGILKGAGYSENAQAAYITHGLEQMAQLITAVGGNFTTAYGLAGVGDLLLTATSMHSRNTQVGVALGQGKTLETILAQTGYTPEGVNTVQSIHQLCMQKNISLPLCQTLYSYLFQSAPLSHILDSNVQ